ncbi:MAG: hypothetical protein NC131_14695 [Roseburia sp.]|nr:hypothetical protein [Roseburia sp.]
MFAEYKKGTITENGKSFDLCGKTIDYIRTIFNLGDGGVMAQKVGKVIARPAVAGEDIIVYSHRNTISALVTGVAGEYVLTKADMDGKIILDKDKHRHMWQVPRNVLERNYVIPDEGINGKTVLDPVQKTQWFMQIDRNIAIPVRWGEYGMTVNQLLEQGDYINISDENDMYGVPRQDFNDTYQKFISIDRSELATYIGVCLLKYIA